MATAIHAPRINNNDDEVKVVGIDVRVGERVCAGQIVGQVETDKALLDVSAATDGYVLAILAAPEQLVRVGSVMFWLGETADEAVPATAAAEAGDATHPAGSAPSPVTAKARLLIAENGLDAAAIAPIDGRVTVDAVQRHLAQRAANPAGASPTSGRQAVDTLPEVAGTAVDLSREERGMAATVAWQRDFAAPGYLEIDYDPAPWGEFARRFQEENGLLLPPLLPLMAWQLVTLASQSARLNATLVAGKRYEYSQVNLGFTIQSGESLYLAVLRNAQGLDAGAFVNALGEVLRRAAGQRLRESEVSGATIGFSSMERWKVSRHVPVLAPHSALMIAHAAGQQGRGVLGATYDHRVLNGGQVVGVLRQLATPPTVPA